MTNTVMDSPCMLQSGVTVISLERDYGSTQLLKLTRLEAQLHSTLDSSPKTLLLDLSDTALIGAAFLSVLIRCSARAASLDCRFALCTLKTLPADAVSIANLDLVWLTYDSRQVAIEALVPLLDGRVLS